LLDNIKKIKEVIRIRNIKLKIYIKIIESILVLIIRKVLLV
jgi:hypothetical protein